MDGLELHGQGSQAAVAGQPERGVLVENLPVQVHTDVCPHVLWADGEDLDKRKDGKNDQLGMCPGTGMQKQ